MVEAKLRSPASPTRQRAARKLRLAREAKGWSLERAALELRGIVSARALGDLERGRARMTSLEVFLELTGDESAHEPATDSRQNRALSGVRDAGGRVQERAPSGGGDAGGRGRDERRDAQCGPLHPQPDGHVLQSVGAVQRGAEAGLLELAAPHLKDFAPVVGLQSSGTSQGASGQQSRSAAVLASGGPGEEGRSQSSPSRVAASGANSGRLLRGGAAVARGPHKPQVSGSNPLLASGGVRHGGQGEPGSGSVRSLHETAGASFFVSCTERTTVADEQRELPPREADKPKEAA